MRDERGSEVKSEKLEGEPGPWKKAPTAAGSPVVGGTALRVPPRGLLRDSSQSLGSKGSTGLSLKSFSLQSIRLFPDLGLSVT